MPQDKTKDSIEERLELLEKSLKTQQNINQEIVTGLMLLSHKFPPGTSLADFFSAGDLLDNVFTIPTDPDPFPFPDPDPDLERYQACIRRCREGYSNNVKNALMISDVNERQRALKEAIKESAACERNCSKVFDD